MNGFWFPWSEGINGNKPGEFVAAWRHVHDIFTAGGATNATWVWCPNVDFTSSLTPLEELYPGDDYVDWTCLDGFNWGKTANSAGWQSFNQVFHSTYKRMLKIAPSKPMVIGEIASDERGGSKADWISNLLASIPAKYRKVRGLIWYEEKDHGTRWPIESSQAGHQRLRQGHRAPGLPAEPVLRPHRPRPDPSAALGAPAASALAPAAAPALAEALFERLELGLDLRRQLVAELGEVLLDLRQLRLDLLGVDAEQLLHRLRRRR